MEIYDNEVYNGEQAGIFLHRSADDAKVYSEFSFGTRTTKERNYQGALAGFFYEVNTLDTACNRGSWVRDR